MSKTWLTKGMALFGLVGCLGASALASYDESTGVQTTNADPSPNNGTINDYTQQDEQLNLDPRAGLVKVLRTDQKSLVNDYVTELIPISNVTPREIRSAVRSATGMEGGRAEVVRDKVSGKNYVQVVCPKFQLPYLRSAVRALDEEWVEEYNDGADDLYLKMKFRDAADVDVIASEYAAESGFSEIDTTNNAARRFDEVCRLEAYENAVKLIDIPENQVTLEVTVYNVNLNDDMKIGLDYIGWSNGPGRALWSFATAGYSAEQRAQYAASGFDPYVGLITGAPGVTNKTEVYDVAARESYRALNYVLPSNYIDFLHSKGQATVVTSQTITVLSSDTGSISTMDQLVSIVNNSNEIGDTIDSAPFSVGVDTSGQYPVTTSADTSSRELTYSNSGSVGMDLEVTPYVGTESMELVIDMELAEQTGVSSSGAPIISARTVSTTVRLLDGQPFVIAGLTQTNDLNNSAKAPWIGDIPVLGYLVGGELDTNTKNETVVTITPHFVLSSDHKVGVPQTVETLKNVVAGDEALGLPDASLGFDMWLLDGVLSL